MTEDNFKLVRYPNSPVFGVGYHQSCQAINCSASPNFPVEDDREPKTVPPHKGK